MSEVQDRVARGIEWLDGHIPEWFIKVDPYLLDISSLSQCVLGQLAQAEGLVEEGDIYSPFGMARLEWFGDEDDADHTVNWLGFDIEDVDSVDLTEEWRGVIRHRRLEASVTEPSHD